jgi:hypothetical protein
MSEIILIDFGLWHKARENEFSDENSEWKVSDSSI